MRKLLYIFLSLTIGFAFAQKSVSFDSVTLDGQDYLPSATLPTDANIVSGQLENGLDYYLYPNTEPHNRAELALVISAGSVQEDEDQLGLAHLLEHMLFNGTERFPGQELISFLVWTH